MDVVIAAGARTPIGSFLGALSTVPAHRLGAAVIVEVLKRAGLSPQDVDEVLMGQVLTAAQGQNPARQAAIAAGIPKEKTAMTINQVCGSGLRAVALGFQAIRNGDAAIVVAGGQESMSLSPHAAMMRQGQKMGDMSFVDTMVRDGLWDAFNDYHMGETAEILAANACLSREAQDHYAVRSQNRAEAAQKEGRFKEEIVPVSVPSRKGEVLVDADEYIRQGATTEGLKGLKPAFRKEGTVTAANASGLNDGAAAVVLMSREEADRRALTPLARIVSWATCGVDPSSTLR